MTTQRRRRAPVLAPNGETVNLHTLRAVWAAITANPRASTREVADAAGIRSATHAACCLAALEEAGYIDRGPPGASRTTVVLVPLYAERGCRQ